MLRPPSTRTLQHKTLLGHESGSLSVAQGPLHTLVLMTLEWPVTTGKWAQRVPQLPDGCAEVGPQ